MTTRIIDITQSLGPEMPVWPGDPQVAFAPAATWGCEGVRVTRIELGSHTGTHLDAGHHLWPDGDTVDLVPLEALIGPALLVDMADVAVVRAADLARAVPEGGPRRLLLRGGGVPAAPGTHDGEARSIVLDQGAAEWLVAQRYVLLGVESMSVDRADSETLPVHRALLGAGMAVVEGLVLRGVAPGVYNLCCLPLPVRGLDGAPVRAVLETIE